jgi:DNA processing protein
LPNAVPAPAAHILEWLARSLTFGLGPTKARKLIEHFGYAEVVFHASLTELESTGSKAVSAQSVATGKSAELAREEMARAAAAGVTALSPEDACYASRLQEIYDLPFVLYVRGNPEGLTQPGIAMVGTRHPTPHGLGMADRLAGDLVVQGLVINQRHGPRRRHCQSSRGRSRPEAKRSRYLGQGLT